MKTLLSALFALVIFASPARAVSLQVLESNGEFIEFNQGGTVFRIFLDTLRQGSIALRTADLTKRVQTFMGVRLLRAELPFDEPTKMVDPGGFDGGGFGERFYWCVADGTPTPGDDKAATHVCSQADIIEDVFWDGTAFIFTIRVARDCTIRPEFASCQ